MNVIAALDERSTATTAIPTAEQTPIGRVVISGSSESSAIGGGPLRDEPAGDLDDDQGHRPEGHDHTAEVTLELAGAAGGGGLGIHGVLLVVEAVRLPRAPDQGRCGRHCSAPLISH